MKQTGLSDDKFGSVMSSRVIGKALTNEEMLWRAYQYYATNRQEIENRSGVSGHKQGAEMG
ncbi:MAG: hypothetical protein JO217_06700 [Acidobacteriaceae bacterium]|nr:hypothetical protein [Acidobacteriaceae bacterium]